MSAVAKAAWLRKCRDCEETLLHRQRMALVANAALKWAGERQGARPISSRERPLVGRF